MFYVYMLRSENEPDKNYIGFTANLNARLAYHNAEGSPVTRITGVKPFPRRVTSTNEEGRALRGPRC